MILIVIEIANHHSTDEFDGLLEGEVSKAFVRRGKTLSPEGSNTDYVRTHQSMNQAKAIFLGRNRIRDIVTRTSYDIGMGPG